MNAAAHSIDTGASGTTAPLLRTLLLSDLVDSTALIQRLGDQRAAQILRRHDRLMRASLQEHGGREIDKTDGFLVLFERPVQAVAFALDYQRALKQLAADEGIALAARIGIHVGDVVAWDNAPDDVARGAKPFEVEGLVKPITSRLMQLALPQQILLSGVAHALAHRAQGELGGRLSTLRWRTHGRYRFKGVPDPIAVFEVGEEGLAPLKAPPWSGKAHREVPFWRRPATLGIEVGLLLAAFAVPAWYLLKPEPAIAFAQRDWVVLGDLRNLTDQPAFDDAVQTAFRIGLEQSRYVNVLSDLKTRETLALMQRDPDRTTVDRAIGAEVAIRDGARALILPTVAEIGGRVRVTAEVVDPATQTTVWSESANGSGSESVLPSLDEVNQKLRVRLGEALATVSHESRPLEKVATRNLAALRAYSIATSKYGEGDYTQALALFDEALRLDPGFALAHVGRASALFSSDRSDEAMASLRKAAAMSDRLTPRDSLYVAAWQGSFGPPAQALVKWKTLATMFPDFFKGSAGYAFFAWQLGNDFEDATSAARQAASDRNPNRATSDYLLGVLDLGQERYAEAERNFARAQDAKGAAHGEFRSMVPAAQRRFAEARRILDGTRASGEKSVDLYPEITRIAMLVDQGQWQDALDRAERVRGEARSVGERKEREFGTLQLALQSLAQPQSAFGDRLARIVADELQANTNERTPEAGFRILFAAYLAAHAGQASAATAALAAVAPQMEGDYPLIGQMSKIARAELARSEGHPELAISLLQPLLGGSEPCLAHVALMDAYASAGKPDKALDQAGWLAAHRGRAYVEYGSERVLMPFNVAQTDLALLRGAELAGQQGALERSGSLLAEFRQAWPHADALGFVAPRLRSLATPKH